MFSRSKSKAAPVAANVDDGAAAADRMPSLIGSDLSVLGDMTSDGPLQIDGAVDGDVRCPILTVGPKASVRGSIVASVARIAGSVQGRIHASQVELAQSAEVIGDIEHESLAIEAGAFVDGKFKRLEGTPLLTADAGDEARQAAAGDD